MHCWLPDSLLREMLIYYLHCILCCLLAQCVYNTTTDTSLRFCSLSVCLSVSLSVSLSLPLVSISSVTLTVLSSSFFKLQPHYSVFAMAPNSLNCVRYEGKTAEQKVALKELLRATKNNSACVKVA